MRCGWASRYCGAADFHQRRRTCGNTLHDRSGRDALSDQSTLLELDMLPRHLVIIGGGYVGLEFGQIFRRFGSQVTIIDRTSRLIGHEDEDVSREVQAILERDGIQVRLNATCIELMRHGEEVGVRVDCAEGEAEVSGSHLLLAMGRTPNTADLGLEKPGSHTMLVDISSSTINCVPMLRASGHWVIATDGEDLRTPPTTTSRSSPPTCWTTRRAASQTGSGPTISMLILHSGDAE